MSVDEETEEFMKNDNLLGSDKRVGIWHIIVVRNVPYTDTRRNGKVPKLLLHRLFPDIRYSIWIDAKLQLVVDPYQILERFGAKIPPLPYLDTIDALMYLKKPRQIKLQENTEMFRLITR
ncbi:uncharacterized protein LOC111380393 [Olea europaea subsp. europaea]|uniref:Uncharacterized protein LOC111380393 n=1 Tax=Olea europaea subsp. europaea TaxID=158383 RepID=A0A8S0TY36_OLEEU|nr:uncharacterized protein LOC111380393 [Olea europaea subsp. europaea]